MHHKGIGVSSTANRITQKFYFLPGLGGAPGIDFLQEKEMKNRDSVCFLVSPGSLSVGVLWWSKVKSLYLV